MDPLTLDIIATVVTALLALVGLCGIVVPVLPGSITIMVALLIWGLLIGGTFGWIPFGIGVVFLAAGMSASYIFAGKALKKHAVPKRSILIGIIGAIIGFFVIPFLGIFVGFVIGLWLGEYLLKQDVGAAFTSAYGALKGIGVGMLIELTCAMITIAVWGGFALGFWLSAR